MLGLAYLPMKEYSAIYPLHRCDCPPSLPHLIRRNRTLERGGNQTITLVKLFLWDDSFKVEQADSGVWWVEETLVVAVELEAQWRTLCLRSLL